MHDAGHNTGVGDEGGFAPNLSSAEAALSLHRPGRARRPATAPARTSTSASDAAASEFFKDGRYNMVGEGAVLDGDGMVDYLAGLVAKFPIVSIEDGCAEDDFEGWKQLTACS